MEQPRSGLESGLMAAMRHQNDVELDNVPVKSSETQPLSNSVTQQNTHSSYDSQAEHGEKVETRAYRAYFLRRPRALQYTYKHKYVRHGDHGKGDGESPLAYEELARHRERLDLFIDLIWVGIITNLSEVYSQLFFEPAGEDGGEASEAVGLFILVFTMSWRIWNFLREFLNDYHMDDFTQRCFVFWILALSVFYGNNIAYIPGNTPHIKANIIVLYLFIRASFVIMECVYSIFIPWMRRLQLVNFLISLPSIALWIATIYIPDAGAVGTAVFAILWEYIVPMAVFYTPISKRLIPTEYRKAVDPQHFSKRIAAFFIITVGEGVLVLVKDGPLGHSINNATGLGILALLIYFVLSFLYFNKDGSKTYVSAVTERGYGGRLLAWIFWHVPLFSCFIPLSASVLFIIKGVAEQTDDSVENAKRAINVLHLFGSRAETTTEPEAITPEQEFLFIRRAVWTIGISLAVIVLSMTILALLDTPRDPPGTLRVNNRYIRMSGRVIYAVLVVALCAAEELSEYWYLGIACTGLVWVILWEWTASMDRGGKFIEPRNLAQLMRSEPGLEVGKTRSRGGRSDSG